MPRVRPLDEQFEPEEAARIRSVQDRLAALKIRFDVSRYFVVEIIRCLEAGMLLSGLLVATALLELLVRVAVVNRRVSVTPSTSTVEPGKVILEIHRAVEEDRSLGFSTLVMELEGIGVLSTSEAAELRRIYSSNRIPLHHAIIHRFIRFHTDPEWRDFLDESGLAAFSTGRDFEEAIETQAISLLEEVCSGVEQVVSKGAV
jgi:hypothetical protein